MRGRLGGVVGTPWIDDSEDGLQRFSRATKGGLTVGKGSHAQTVLSARVTK